MLSACVCSLGILRSGLFQTWVEFGLLFSALVAPFGEVIVRLMRKLRVRMFSNPIFSWKIAEIRLHHHVVRFVRWRTNLPQHGQLIFQMFDIARTRCPAWDAADPRRFLACTSSSSVAIKSKQFVL